MQDNKNNILNILENKLRIQELKEKEIINMNKDENNKDKIEVRVTKDEKEIIKSLARLNHMNVSEFIRYLTLNKYINEVIK